MSNGFQPDGEARARPPRPYLFLLILSLLLVAPLTTLRSQAEEQRASPKKMRQELVDPTTLIDSWKNAEQDTNSIPDELRQVYETAKDQWNNDAYRAQLFKTVKPVKHGEWVPLQIGDRIIEPWEDVEVFGREIGRIGLSCHWEEYYDRTTGLKVIVPDIATMIWIAATGTVPWDTGKDVQLNFYANINDENILLAAQLLRKVILNINEEPDYLRKDAGRGELRSVFLMAQQFARMKLNNLFNSSMTFVYASPGDSSVTPTPPPRTETPVTAVPNSSTPTPTASVTRKATSDICPDPPCTTATPTTTVTHTPTNTPTVTPTITLTPVPPTREITATPATPVVPTPQKESLPAVYEVQDKFKVEFWPPYPLVIGQDYKGDQWIRRGVDYRITIRIPAWMPALKDNCPFCYGKIGDMGPCKDGWGYTPDRAIIHPVPGPGGSYVRYRRVTGLYIEARLRPESVAWIQGELARKYPGAKVYQELYVLADWRDPEGLRPGMRLGPERNLVVESVRDIAQNGRYYTEVVLRQGPGPEPGNPQGRSPWSSERHDPNRPTSVQFRDPGNYDFVVRVTSRVPQSAGCPEPELPGGVAKTGEECWSRPGPDDPWNPYFGPCERMRESIQEEFRPNQPIVVYLVDTTLLGSW